MSDYDLTTTVATGDLTDPARGWAQAVALGFGQASMSDESLDRWWGDETADAVRLRSASPKEHTAGLPADTPVATFGSLDKTINTGHGHLEPANLVTDVTVRTSHRRRGLLRHLMRTDLGEARERGLTLASLTASEGGIYGRFGFGVASRRQSIDLDAGGRFALHHVARGADVVEIVASAGAAPLLRRVFDAVHATRRGSHDRPRWYDDFLTGAWDSENARPDHGIRVAVAFDAGGEPTGHVVYKFAGASVFDADEPLKILDLLATSPAVELELWRFVASIDLSDKVRFGNLDPASPLPWALVDPRVIGFAKTSDFTWLRLLDVPGALRVRGFDAAGEVTFAVDDPLGISSGAWRLEVRDGVATAESVAGADLRLRPDALGTLYAGFADARVLASAGLITGAASDVARLARLFATDDHPYCVTSF